MSLVRTPYAVTRRQKLLREQEQMANNDKMKKLQEHEVKSEPLLQAKKKMFASEGSPSTRASSAAMRKRLELEAVRKRAEIELEAVEASAAAAAKKAALQKVIVDAELDAELADLEENSRHSTVSSKDRVQDWLNKSRREMVTEKEEANPISYVPPRTDIQELASAIKAAISTTTPKNHNQELLTRLATSKDLPTYFGDPLEWLQFKNAFSESTALCNYSDNENMWRLRKSLRGEAKDAVSSLLIGGSSPHEILKTLELRFGRPELVMQKIITQLKKLSPLPQAYHSELVQFSIKIKNYVAAAIAINQMDYLRSPELVTIIISKLPTSLVTKWADYAYSDESDAPKLERLAEFLYLEAQKVAASGVSFINTQLEQKRKPEHYKNIKQHHVLTYSDSESFDCKFCKSGKHSLGQCNKYKKAMRKDRWRFARVQKLCFKCLQPRHADVTDCTAPACDVEECGLPHHRLLHWVKKRQEPAVQEQEQSSSEAVNHATALQCRSVNKVLLKIVPVSVHGPKGSVHTHALLDDGSTVTLISADITDKVGLRGEPTTMRARGAWDSGELVNPVLVEPTTDRALDRATATAHAAVACNVHVSNVPVSSCLLTQRSDALSHSHTDLAPAIDPNNQVNSCSMNHQQELLQLRELIHQYCSLESIGIGNRPRVNANELRAVEILNNTCELVDNRWTVGLPWKSDDFVMPNSYNCAVVRLKSVIRKMESNLTYASRYQDRIDHLFTNNYARAVTAGETSRRTWYLPHFGVDNPNKKNLRLVFDAAAKSDGCSLNDFLLQGPDLLNSLYGIMYRFREYPIAVVGDIKDMFLCIKIREDDQHALRFLWKNKDGTIREYAMTSLIFGANCSPFVAQYINQTKNASRFKESLPDAVHAIQNNQYMDDFILSLQDETCARKIAKDVSYIHQQGGFHMRNWISNVPTILQDIPEEDQSENMNKVLLNNCPERTLGLLWYPATDTLAFDLSLKRIPIDILNLSRKPTKREVLRLVMSIFDIHGFLGPITIKGKIIMQQTWKLNIKWEEEITNDLFNCFQSWIIQLKKVNQLRLPRWYFSTSKQNMFYYDKDSATMDYEGVAASTIPMDSLSTMSPDPEAVSVNGTKLELHVFCDASPHAYAAVAYWRKQCSDGNYVTSFIGSKSRVTPPSKSITIPRLELQGAVLACRLADGIQKEHRLKPSAIYYWTDSTTVLHWLRNDTRNYKIFVANRLGEIDELSKISDWHYVPTELNVADLATKNSDFELNSCHEWFTGPLFLRREEMDWPKQPAKNINISDIEHVNTMQKQYINNKYIPVPDPSRFSSWLRLVRATASVFLFIEKCKKNNMSGLTDQLMHKAEILLLRYAQAESFNEEINLIKKGKDLKADSRLRTLTPLLDHDGLLRVGGRIGAAVDVSQEAKYPIIIDGRHHIARLIVRDYHIRAGHAGNELVVNEMRQKYWLIRLRPTVRTVASQCLICRIRKAKPVPSRLGDLPEARLNHHQRAFTVCGVDLFGPMEITAGRQKLRRYGVLFTCLTVRAVHIELVSTLTTDAFIMALRRMAARRGWPKRLYSDNGTNLRGADTELKKAFQELDKEELAMQAVNKGVDWYFIPPASPHMGGSWERLIRSVKSALKVVLKERSPKEEVLTTLLAEVENIVNSRPLTHVSVDPHSQEALTPNHFLIGSSSNLPKPGVFDEGDLYLRKQWRTAQRLADLFWSRWLKEVLPTLVPRHKWQQEGVQLKEGDLVVIVDPSSPRNCWPKGVVEAVYPGRDGRVRVVDVRTRTNVMKRPVTRVALLFGDECRKTDTRGEDVGDGTLKKRT